jgi:hypothetical protein
MGRDRIDRPLERWARSHNPDTLLELVRERVPEAKRKYRLLAAACCRRAWAGFDEPRREALRVIERYADGESKYTEVRRAVVGLLNEGHRSQPIPAQAAHRDAWAACRGCVSNLLGGGWGTSDSDLDEKHGRSHDSQWFTAEAWPDARAALCHLIRDAFGHLFEPVALERAWLTSTVLDLANAAYTARDPDAGTLDPFRLAVLADALQDAGCGDGPLLEHLRGPGPHAPGCWALDRLIGKPL